MEDENGVQLSDFVTIESQSVTQTPDKETVIALKLRLKPDRLQLTCVVFEALLLVSVVCRVSCGLRSRRASARIVATRESRAPRAASCARTSRDNARRRRPNSTSRRWRSRPTTCVDASLIATTRIDSNDNSQVHISLRALACDDTSLCAHTRVVLSVSDVCGAALQGQRARRGGAQAESRRQHARIR
jgi:hypothetical protein